MRAIVRKYGVGCMLEGIFLYESSTEDIRANPTIVAGDVKLSKDGGAFANINTLPTVTPSGGRAIRVTLSATEMQCAQLVIQFVDQSTVKEWVDQVIVVETQGDPASAHPGLDTSATTLADLYEGFTTLFMMGSPDQIQASPPPTTTAAKLGAGTPAGDGLLVGDAIKFLSGAHTNRVVTITASDAAGNVTWEPALATAPAAGDFYILRMEPRVTLTASAQSAISAATWDLVDGVETGLTPREAMRGIAASAFGIVAGALGTTITIAAAKTAHKTRITGTTDTAGNRSAIALDLG